MNPPRLVGLIILIVGIGLVTIGMNASDSMADQVSNTFTGRYAEATTWDILGGIATGIFGILLLLSGFRRSNT